MCHSLCYTFDMKTMGIRDLRNRPGAAWKTLDAGEEMVLTSNGRPVALMLPVDSDTLDETMQAVRRARGQVTLRALRKSARAQGLDSLSAKQIDRLVADVRQERSAGKTRAAR